MVALKFKDFPALTTFFKDFQSLECLLIFKIQGLSRCVQTLSLTRVTRMTRVIWMTGVTRVTGMAGITRMTEKTRITGMTRRTGSSGDNWGD